MSTIKIKHKCKNTEIKSMLNTVFERLNLIDDTLCASKDDNSEKFIEIAQHLKTVDSYITEINTRNTLIDSMVNNVYNKIVNVSTDVDRIRRKVIGIHY